MAARLGMGVGEREALRDHAATLPPPPAGGMHLPAPAALLLAHAPPDAVVLFCAHAGAVAASLGLHDPRTYGGVSQASPPPPSSPVLSLSPCFTRPARAILAPAPDRAPAR